LNGLGYTKTNDARLPEVSAGPVIAPAAAAAKPALKEEFLAKINAPQTLRKNSGAFIADRVLPQIKLFEGGIVPVDVHVCILDKKQNYRHNQSFV
jgi:hypothetical protein